MIMCPKCGCGAQVYGGFEDLDTLRYIRRRKCKACDYKFITVEVITDTDVQVNGTHGGARYRSSPTKPEGGENLFFKRKEEKTLRTCEVDGSKAFFHQWVQDGKAVTFALIEYINGEVEKVNPERVRFTDR